LGTFRRLFSHLFVQVAIRSLRSSALTTGAVLLLSSLGAWQYLGSSLQAMDVRYAAAISGEIPADQHVLVVAIDDQSFQSFFNATSPLRQDALAQLLQTIAHNTPHARKLAVDLDLAPELSTATAAALEAVLTQEPQRWVLAAAPGSTAADNAQRALWRQRLCAKGVSFGVPLVPTDFGYVRMSHQYQASLSDVASSEAASASASGGGGSGGACTAPEHALRVQPAPLSPATLQQATTLAFDGNLDHLAMSLRALDPQWVVIGGTWGNDDVFLSPFGMRFGVQIHAAALAGRLAGLHQVRYGYQLVVAWAFVTLMSLLLSSTSRHVRQWVQAVGQPLPGHQFFETRLLPILLMACVLCLSAVVGCLLGLGYGLSGVWIPSSTVGSVTMIAVMLVWNWGKTDFYDYKNLRDASNMAVVNPLVADWNSMRQTLQSLFGAQRPSGLEAVSTSRQAFEGVMAFLSILLQNVLPLVSVLYALATPL
jgi:CHASE2 domain-containing sensor protein